MSWIVLGAGNTKMKIWLLPFGVSLTSEGYRNINGQPWWNKVGGGREGEAQRDGFLGDLVNAGLPARGPLMNKTIDGGVVTQKERRGSITSNLFQETTQVWLITMQDIFFNYLQFTYINKQQNHLQFQY